MSKKYDYHKMLESLLKTVDGELSLLNMARNNTSCMVTTLSKDLGVSRPTIYLWLKKFDRDRKLILENSSESVEYLKELEANAEYLKEVNTSLLLLYNKTIYDVVAEKRELIKGNIK